MAERQLEQVQVVCVGLHAGGQRLGFLAALAGGDGELEDVAAHGDEPPGLLHGHVLVGEFVERAERLRAEADVVGIDGGVGQPFRGGRRQCAAQHDHQ